MQLRVYCTHRKKREGIGQTKQKYLTGMNKNKEKNAIHKSIRLGESSTQHPLDGVCWVWADADIDTLASGETGWWNWDLDILGGGERDLFAWELLALLARAFVLGGGTIDRSTALVLLALLASGIGVGAVWIDIAAVEATRTWLWKLDSLCPIWSGSLRSWKLRTTPWLCGYRSSGSWKLRKSNKLHCMLRKKMLWIIFI